MAVIQLPCTYYHYVDQACLITIVEPENGSQTFLRPDILSWITILGLVGAPEQALGGGYWRVPNMDQRYLSGEHVVRFTTSHPRGQY